MKSFRWEDGDKNTTTVVCCSMLSNYHNKCTSCTHGLIGTCQRHIINNQGPCPHFFICYWEWAKWGCEKWEEPGKENSITLLLQFIHICNTTSYNLPGITPPEPRGTKIAPCPWGLVFRKPSSSIQSKRVFPNLKLVPGLDTSWWRTNNFVKLKQGYK